MLKENIRTELFRYIVSVFNEINGGVIAANCTENHIHIFAHLPKDMPPCNVIEKIKTSTSKWIKKRFPDLKKFYWQSGYGMFSVSRSNAEELKKYISGQESHHKKMTFEEEYRALLRKHGLEYDERYVWD